MACEGFLVLQRMERDGTKLPAKAAGRLAMPTGAEDDALRTEVCGSCSFREQDCDFTATGGIAPSCGGLVLLRHLLGSGDIVMADITKGRKRDRKTA